MLSTRYVLQALRKEGRKVDMNRIQRLVMEGKLDPPVVVGGSRIWREEDVDRLREAIDEMDGKPSPSTVQIGEADTTN